MKHSLRLLVLSLISVCHAQGGDVLNGAGATFPAPIFRKWIEEYDKAGGQRITYEPIGSGGGIRQMLARSVDFAGTEAVLSDEDMEKAEVDILHLPICIGGVAVSYNIQDLPNLHLTPELISDIFMGRITRWNDRRLSRANPRTRLPDADITVVHRSDTSGTTFIFTDYLSKVSQDWSKEIGSGTTVRWTVGLGGEGNPGVAEIARQIPGSVCYLEFSYSIGASLNVAMVQNRSGQFVAPTIEAISAAADVKLPSDARLLITDTTVRDGYPISGFSWLIFYREQAYDNRSSVRAQALARMLSWMIHEGQEYSKPLFYAPLPPQAIKTGEAIIRSMTYEGEPLDKSDGEK